VALPSVAGPEAKMGATKDKNHKNQKGPRLHHWAFALNPQTSTPPNSAFMLASSRCSSVGLSARLPPSRRLLQIEMEEASAAPARLRRDGKRAFGNPPLGHVSCLRNCRALTSGS